MFLKIFFFFLLRGLMKVTELDLCVCLQGYIYVQNKCEVNDFKLFVEEVPTNGVSEPVVMFYLLGKVNLTESQFFNNLIWNFSDNFTMADFDFKKVVVSDYENNLQILR
jgi:hypothetical protein